MHKVALFNGKLIKTDDANIGALSSAALYGRGVFTTIAIYDGETFLLEKHLRRLQSNADAIGLKCPGKVWKQIEHDLGELVRKNQIINGRSRVTLFDGSAPDIWSYKNGNGVNTLIITADERTVAPELSLMISPFAVNSRSPLAGVKSCSYLENLMAIEGAKACGFDEAIRLNERGEITSACMANLFWLKGDQLFTPSLSTGCLSGTTREFVIENLDCREETADLDEMYSADSLFLTSAGIGIMQVTKLNERVFDRSNHHILELLPPANKKTRMSAK